MKRFSKIFSGIAAIMLGVGIILIAFGLGSARADWDKIKAAQQGTEQIEREFDGIKSMKLDIPFGVLEVAVTEEDRIYFEAENVKSEALKIHQEGENLEIFVNGGKRGLSGLVVFPLMVESRRNGDENAVQVYRLWLPEDYGGKLDIKLGTGRVYLSGIDADEMDISVDAGELVITECKAGGLQAECNIGECSVDGSFRDISVENKVGVLNAYIYGSHDDYNGAIACEIGEMEYHMGLDKMTDYGDAISRVEAWNRSSGLGVHKSWKSPIAEGKLGIKCGIGDVTVVFLSEDRANTAQEMEPDQCTVVQEIAIPQVSGMEAVDSGIPEVSGISETSIQIETSDEMDVQYK